jgi:hypothetical protein
MESRDISKLNLKKSKNTFFLEIYNLRALRYSSSEISQYTLALIGKIAKYTSEDIVFDLDRCILLFQVLDQHAATRKRHRSVLLVRGLRAAGVYG